MPYTPPSQKSPTTSRLGTPTSNRSSSYHHAQTQSPPRSPGPRPNLPRSASSTSYLNRARRSPSNESGGFTSHTSMQPGQGLESSNKAGLSINTSIRTSPPPMTDDAMPRGAIISPPDSTQNSSDDETSFRLANRDVDSLEALERAVRRSLEIKRDGSPESDDDERKSRSSAPASGVRFMDSESSSQPSKLSSQARKISHSRSSTESSIFVPPTEAVNQSLTGSDGSDEDDDLVDGKPPLLRKKSGELVKPAIRPQTRRKVSSMPGTPTYSKAVHFNEDIEQVRHFLSVDRPIAVSAGGSPAEMADEDEFPFGSQGPSSSNLDLRLSNFPRESHERHSQAVRLERLSLSSDQKSLIGACAVANLAFHKLIVARFTFDFWKTTSEVVAEFSTDPRFHNRADGYDQFDFSIKLSDQANLEQKTLLLCVRYNVKGQEFWDNNGFLNFQADFTRKPRIHLPQVDRSGPAAHSIPRSRHSAAGGRPHSMSALDDDFESGFDSTSFQLKGASSRKPVLPDTPPPRRRTQQAGQAFGSRYDFGASLTAALSQAQIQLGERSGIRNKQSVPARANPPTSASTIGGRLAVVPPSASGSDSPRPETLIANKQALDSKAYQDFISKFCFAGSKKPAQNATAPTTQPLTDGAQDEQPMVTAAPNLANGNPDALKYNTKALGGSGGGLRSPPYNPSPDESGRASPVPVAGHIPGRESPPPSSFGYPYNQNHHNEFFSGTQTPIVQS